MSNIYVKIRETYGLSRRSMTRILGFGVNQWARYEEGEIEPKDSHGLMISMIQDPKSMLKLLRRHEEVLRRDLGDGKFDRLIGRCEDLIGEFEKMQDASYVRWVESLYK